jgi:carbonic anhydrase/acetyltransferase-like protein (isoleucine patch superfamily)
MDKKYELIEARPGWYNVKALKDFTLITGEQIKKGDIGGQVTSEDCLSQEGTCWIMDGAGVSGKVSGNAVVNLCAIVYGTVSENAVVQGQVQIEQNALVTGNAVVKGSLFEGVVVEGIVSGNAIVQDNASVEQNAIVTGNAIVQDNASVESNAIVAGNAIVKDGAYVGLNAIVAGNAVVKSTQRIYYGVVTTDLLEANNLPDMLYAEFGIVPKDGKVILRMVMSRVYDKNDKLKYYFSHTHGKSKFLKRDFKFGKTYIVPKDHPPIFLSHGMWDLYDFAEYGVSEDPVIVEFEVYIKDIVGVKENCALVNKFTPLRVMLDEKQYMAMITNKGV